MARKVGGTISVVVNGSNVLAKGSFTTNLGLPKKEMVVGSDRTHGPMEKQQVAFIEGEITVPFDLDVAAFQLLSNATIVLTQGNGQIFILHEAEYAAEGDYQTEEGNLQFRFEGLSADLIPAGA